MNKFKLNKLTFLFFTMLLFVGTTSLEAQQKWTYMVYLFGSDLEGGFEKNGGQYGNAGTNDIQEMMDAGATNNVNIIVTTGGVDKDGWREIKRWKIENGQQIPIEFNAPNNRMADPRNLTDFINWATTNYPAEKYVLDLWNHGSDIQGYGGDEIPQNNHESFKIPQLKQAIQSSNFIGRGNKFEVLGFDACLMANLEVHNAMQSFSNYIVSSEQTEPGHGWNYIPIVRAMENGSAGDGLSLGRIIADGFIAQAREQQTKQVTLSVVENAKIRNVTSAVEQMLNMVGTAGTADLQQARARTEDYASTSTGRDAGDNHDVVDIGHLAQNLKATNSAYASAADAVINAINDAVKYTVKDNNQPNSTGLSLFVPHKLFGAEGAVQTIFNDFYDGLNFSPSIKSFIKKYAELARSEDNGAPSGEEIDPDEDYDDWEEGDFDDGGFDDGGFDDGGLRAGSVAKSRNNEEKQTARAIVNDPSDLETVRVLLIETNALEDENDFLTLGAVLPDNLRYSSDGRLLIEYDWDQEWLGIGGFPVNIQNIKQTSSADSRLLPTSGGGSTNEQLTRGDGMVTTVTIPAVLNPDEDFFGKDIYINYVMTENGYELVSIIPQREEGQPNQGQKERINLVPGDQVMLLYDGFNEVKDDLFDAVDLDAVFTIENGNNDLKLEPILLPLGAEFRIAFELIDFSQQNTIIYDPRTFVTSEIMLGSIASTTGQVDMEVCTGDGVSDIISFAIDDCNTDNDTYVITTDQDIILGAFSGTMEFEGAPVFNFRIYGLAYTGNLSVNYGDHILSSDLAEGDFSLTDNFVAVNVRDAATCNNLQGSIESENKTYLNNTSGNLLAPSLELTMDIQENVVVLVDLLKRGNVALAPNTTKTYPNPADANVYLDLSEYRGKQGDITIINELGQVAKKVAIQAINDGPLGISVASFDEGMYMISIRVDGLLIDTHKFIKQN